MNKKVLGAFAILVIALSVAGFVYAAWYDRVVIDVTAEMGSVTFGFTRIVSSWDWEEYRRQVDNVDEKEVGDTYCELFEPVTDVHTGKTIYKLLEFHMKGVYPQYWGINKFTLDNAGTIPIKILSVKLTFPDGYYARPDPTRPGVLWDVYDERDKNIYNLWLYKEPEDYGPGWAIQPPWLFPGPYGDPFGVRPLQGNQIEPCNELLTEICVDPKQDAEECHTYTFTIEIEAIQWNKYHEYAVPLPPPTEPPA